ncbi:MAG TPA: DNA-directed RNA polymerase subunit alpha [Nitrospiraceae bacterium]|nr:DNA-directed RNA polymerase subunit alpha [Nitrospiraceae bacterium]
MDLKKKGFQLPEKVYFEEESLTSTYGKLYAEPFEKGFGITLGNSLRRVLLSSLEGAAVTAIRIPGVLHEFSTIPGIKEDVVDIILNIKQLKFRLHGDSEKTVAVEATGPGEVKGKDIIAGAQVEILTPKQHIATLDKGANFELEMTLKKGRGYVLAERNKEEGLPIGIIAVDSIFTPVKKVNFWIEGARVGQATDYDRLIMEIWTDGSITPQKAVSQAANILIGHLSLFSMEEDESLKEETVIATGGSNTSVFNENLLKTVEEMELSIRSVNCLKNANIRTIADLVQKTEPEMLKTKNFGKKSLNEIKEMLHGMGLHFGMGIDLDLYETSAQKETTNAS